MKDEKSVVELEKLLSMIDSFSFKMKERIIKKHLEGKRGWEIALYKSLLNEIEERLDRAENEDPEALIGLANFAMLAYFKHKIENK